MSETTDQDRAALEAIRALRLGHCYLQKSGRRTVLTTIMEDATDATPTRLDRMAGRVEAQGLRVVDRRIHDATLRVECVASERTVGTVTRVSRNLANDATLLMLHGTANAGVWSVPDHAVEDVRMALLTKVDDEITLWRDVDPTGAPGRVSRFHNRTMPALG
jgi:hypothetical protein